MTESLDRLRAALAGRYEVEREVGRGGMAAVYLARDERHKRAVALKVLHPDLTASLGKQRFLREIETAAQLTHPNILALYDSGEADGQLYYVMPFVEGDTLRSRIARSGELPVAECVRILRDLAEALAYAHQRNIIHRDLKPDNVLLVGQHAVLTDFGVAKAVSQAADDASLTSVGIALGRPAYMAPVQAAADPQVDARADLYALGVVAYEMLAGEPPFRGRSAQAVLAAHMAEAPQPMQARRPSVPPALADLVMRLLEKRPADRPQSAAEVSRQLDDVQTTSGGTPPILVRADASRHRRIGMLAGAGLAVAVLVGTALVFRNRTLESGLDPRRVVVAPFENRTADPRLDPIGDMVLDWVTQGLSRTGVVQVVDSRTALVSGQISARQPGAGAGKLEPAARIHALAEATGAGTVVWGNYYREGDSLRFQAWVTDAAKGEVLRSLDPVKGAVDEPEAALELLRQRITGALASTHDPKLADFAGAASQPPTYDAYVEFLQGMESWLAGDNKTARDRFARAAELDPSFALARVNLAWIHWNLQDRVRADSVAKSLSNRTSELAPYDRASLSVLLAWIRGDYETALRHAREQMRIAPRSEDAARTAADVAVLVGRHNEALRAMERVDLNRGFSAEDPGYWLFRTEIIHLISDFDRELKEVRSAIPRYSGERRLRAAEARALIGLRQWARAESLVVTMAVPADRDSARLLYLAAREFLVHGNRPVSQRLAARTAWFRTLAPAQQQSVQFRHTLAHALMLSAQPLRARPVWEKLAADAPDSIEFLGNAGGRRDSVLFAGAYGYARRQPPVGNTLETRFELASLSKLFTAVAVAQLVQSGKLRFESTIAEVLPDYPNPRTASRISIHHLLTHTSGLPDFYRNGKIRRYEDSIRSLRDYWVTFAMDSLWSVPGESFDYSNSNYIVLGNVIERLSGISFEEYVRRFIFAPAGMSRTCYCEPGAEDRATPYSRYTSGFGPTRRAVPDRWVEIPPGARRPGAPAGGGISTAGDIARFATALLGNRLLGPDMTRRVLSDQLKLASGERRGYGFEIDDWFGTRLVGHGGNFWGVMSQLDIYPASGHVVVVLSNNDASGGEAVRNWTRRALAGVR